MRLSTRTALGAAAGFVAVLVGLPWYLRARAAHLVADQPCVQQDDRVLQDLPPDRRFYDAIALDARASRFPGFGPSERIEAAAGYCTASFASACWRLDDAAAAARRDTPADRFAEAAERDCEIWRRFARHLAETGIDVRDTCRACADADPIWPD